MASTLPELRACPNCNAHFLNSTLLEETNSYLKLKCENCANDFRVPNTGEQRKRLSNVYGIPSQIEQLHNIEQVRVGDAIAFKRRAFLVKYEHHAIVTAVDRNLGTITVVEFAMNLPLRKGYIVKEEKSFRRHIRDENAWIRRYMPLDCSPLPEVMARANRFIDDPKSAPDYHSFVFNCQHLVSWVKTGELRSDDGDRCHMIYTYAINGLYVISLFSNPVVTFGLILVDAYVRGSAINVQMQLVNQGMANPDIIMRGIMAWLLLIIPNWIKAALFPGTLIVPSFTMLVNPRGFVEFQES